MGKRGEDGWVKEREVGFGKIRDGVRGERCIRGGVGEREREDGLISHFHIQPFFTCRTENREVV